MKDMTKGIPLKLILTFAVPVLMSNLVHQIYSLCDAVMIGRMIGTQALAAIGATLPVFFLLGFMSINFTSGLTAITAQYFGKKDYEKMRQSIATSTILSLIFAVIFTLCLLMSLSFLLRLTDVPQSIFNPSYNYLFVTCSFCIVLIAFILIQSFLRAVGNSKGPLYFLILSSLLNVVFNYIFIKYFNLGVVGSAYGTIVAVFISLIGCYFYTLKYYSLLIPQKQDWKFSKAFAKEHLKVAIPMGFKGIFISLSIFVFQKGCNSFGEEAIAAIAAANRIENLFCCIFFSLGLSLTTYVAQNFGCSRIARIKKGVRQTLVATTLLAIIVGIIVITFNQQLLGMFLSKEDLNAFPQIVELTKTYLTITGCSYVFLGLISVYVSALPGMGNGWLPFLSGIIELLLRIFAVFVLTEYIGFKGVAFANSLSWIGSGLFLIAGYYYEIRKFNRV